MTLTGNKIVKLPITAEQARFLNEYAEAVARYRSALQEQIDNDQFVLDALSKSSSTHIRPRYQTGADVIEGFARLDQMNKTVWTVFNTETIGSTTVGEYLAKASEHVGEDEKSHSIFNRWIFEADLSR